MITADTITDEQIRELREPASEDGEGCSDGIPGSGRWLTAAEVITLCDCALADHSVQCDSHSCSSLCGEDSGGISVRDARAKCADIINNINTRGGRS